jgi:hypothetical protein
MPTFAQIAKGRLARKTVELPLAGSHADSVTGEWRGESAKVDLRVLTGVEQLTVLEKARAAAKARGVDDPIDGDPIYDLALVVETLLLACIDIDSPDDAPRPYFSSADEILRSPMLTRDHLAFLYESQLAWQDECSPRLFTMQPEEVRHSLERLARADMSEVQRFLLRMRPGMLASFLHFTAVLWSHSLNPKSSSTQS